MKLSLLVRGGSAAAILAIAGAAAAHHSLSGQFDVGRTFDITGVVSRVDWVNPHVYVYVDTKSASGAVTTYKIESLPVAMMRKAGVSRQMLMAENQPVHVSAHPARNGTPTLGYMVVLKFADGREVQFARVPGAEQP